MWQILVKLIPSQFGIERILYSLLEYAEPRFDLSTPPQSEHRTLLAHSRLDNVQHFAEACALSARLSSIEYNISLDAMMSSTDRKHYVWRTLSNIWP